jgi:hypothetical protein
LIDISRLTKLLSHYAKYYTEDNLNLMNLVFTLCSNNYLGQAKVLVDSFIKHNPETPFVIGLVDRKSDQIDYSNLSPATILACEDLGYDCFAEMMARYNIVEFNTAVKPFYFEFFFSKGYTRVIYFDPDIQVFEPLDNLYSELNEFDVLMTPHTLTPFHIGDFKWQRVSNLVGVYNFGFVGIAKSDNTAQLLNWWKGLLKTNCFMCPAEGLFVDQIWSNHFMVFFEKVRVLKDPGYNVGYWNFGERILEYRNGKYFVNNLPLHFFHFSNIKPSQPDVISGYSDFTFSERPDLKGIYREYFTLLDLAGFPTYKKIKVMLPLRKDDLSSWSLLGLRLKVHGTRYLNKVLQKIFRF